MSARGGCLTVSALIALVIGGFSGLVFRSSWRTPSPLRPLSTAVGEAAFAAEAARVRAHGLVPQGAPSSGPTLLAAPGWSRIVERIDVGEDECVAVVFATIDGYATPRFAGLFAPQSAAERTFDQRIFEHPSWIGTPFHGDSPWFVSTTSEGATVTLSWCARRPKSLEARVLFQTVDGFQPPRRAEANARWQVFRAPWRAIGGPSGLPSRGMNPRALAELAAEFVDPLSEATRSAPPGLVAAQPSHDVVAGAAALIPVNERAVALLWDLAARNRGSTGSGIAVHPRIHGALSDQERSIVQATFARLAEGRPLPEEHDAIVDLGRNDFHRVLAVIDAESIANDCRTITFARGEGLFQPQITRYNRRNGERTPVGTVRDNVATDRVCRPDGVIAYLVDDTDQQTYRITTWGPAAKGSRER
jgi:hypothetical protein